MRRRSFLFGAGAAAVTASVGACGAIPDNTVNDCVLPDGSGAGYELKDGTVLVVRHTGWQASYVSIDFGAQSAFPGKRVGVSLDVDRTYVDLPLVDPTLSGVQTKSQEDLKLSAIHLALEYREPTDYALATGAAFPRACRVSRPRGVFFSPLNIR